MDYDEIKAILNDYEEFSIHCCYRVQDKYITLVPSITVEIKSKIKEIIKDNIQTYKEKNHVSYNQVGALDDTVEICKVDSFPIVHNLITAVDEPHQEDIKPEEIEFLIYEISSGNSKVLFLRRHNRLRTFRKKGFIASIREGHFNVLKHDDFVGIDDKIDLIIYGNEISILYHVAFERIFNLQKGFIKAATEVINNEKIARKIENFGLLKEELLSNMNYVKRVSKLKDVGTSLLFLENIQKTKEVIDLFNLDIETNKSGQLIYRDKSQLGEFVNLMQDAYYKTLIGDNKGVDERG